MLSLCVELIAVNNWHNWHKHQT